MCVTVFQETPAEVHVIVDIHIVPCILAVLMNGYRFQQVSVYNALVYCCTNCLNVIVCVQIVHVFFHIYLG
jgi:hypothetical protein